LNRIWYVDPKPPPWLLPIEILFAAVSGFRRWVYASNMRSSARLACAVIVVGNLSVGGTGKTPLVCWLVDRLRERGYKPGVVTRGYGGSARHPRRVTESDDAALVGDEPILLARRTAVPVAVGRDRPAGAQLLIEAGCDVIVSDDGLQHYALARDCEIVVVDAERGFGNGHLLPAGPLRESTSRLAQVDAIVVNGAAAAAPARAAAGAADLRWAAAPNLMGGEPALTMRLEPLQAVSLLTSRRRGLQEFAGQTVHAVAGIGNPQRFFNMLTDAGLEVKAHELPDHAALHPGSIEFGDGLAVLMTEKDAVKCAAFAASQHWYVPVSAAFEPDEGSVLLGIVTRLIEQRKGS
jgi:tetraacyldisaccharide 4'-kinase